MKLSQKLTAVLLSVCLLLSVVPTLAATITVDNETGLELPNPVTVGCNSTTTINYVFQPDTMEAALIGFDNAGKTDNAYVGATLSFNAVQNGTYANGSTYGAKDVDAPGQFTVENIPVVASNLRAGYDNQIILKCTVSDLVKYSPELTAFMTQKGYTDSQWSYAMSEWPSYTFNFSNFVIKPGTTENVFGSYQTTDSLPNFPEGTVFLSASNFAKYPAAWGTAELGTPTEAGIYRKYTNGAVATGAGPTLFFEAKEDGEYNLWARILAYSTLKGARTVTVDFNAVNASFEVPETLPEGFADGEWLWVPETADKTITLKAGDVVAVQLSESSGAYAAANGFALVKTADNAAVKTAMAEGKNAVQTEATSGNLKTLQDSTTVAYTPAFGSAVSVTVDGTSVSPAGGTAMSAKYPVRLSNGAIVTDATVLDALVAAGSVTAAEIKDGKLKDTSRKVYVNNVETTDLDWTVLKAGDAITIPTDKTNFKSVTIYKVGRNDVLGTETYNGEDHLKIVTDDTWYEGYAPTLLFGKGTAGEEDLPNNFVGCYLNGYLELAADTNGIPAGSKVYFENLRINKVNTASRGGYTSTDLLVPKIARNESDTQYGIGVLLPDGTYTHKPFTTAPQLSYYIWNNNTKLHITNSSSSNEIQVTKTGVPGQYELSTTGTRFIQVVIVNLSEGKMTDVANTYNMLLTVVDGGTTTIQVNGTQKAYVWDYQPYNGENTGGTTLQPVCAPLVYYEN